METQTADRQRTTDRKKTRAADAGTSRDAEPRFRAAEHTSHGAEHTSHATEPAASRRTPKTETTAGTTETAKHTLLYIQATLPFELL
ncbi:MAG TPA: hypothetical protein DCG33_08935 [Prevotellaceae bacterium]|nr:hypothetical protein [Prevotellaceae bacterium]